MTTHAVAQTTAPARYISPLNCNYKGRVGAINLVESGDTKFKVSQKGHDEYNRFSISKETKISGINVGSFIFKSLPTREDLDNGAYSKKLHFDIYDYGNLNGKKDAELIRVGDTIYVTFLVKFATPAPTPEPGSEFDKEDARYWRTLFFQFWQGGVATHLYSYAHDTPEAKDGKFGYVTVLTADYGENKFVLSDRFEVERGQWYRMYFQYNPDVRDGKILAKMARHREDLATEDMTTMLELKGATFYQDRPKSRVLPTFGNYHWGGCPHKVESHFTEILISKEPLQQHSLLGGRAVFKL
ncbi:hypothetical protein [Novipirellula artificiosorum]|uniref:hypothetical protein n=1 Tax=Novipirellula artificiosorum TaxID=2528016 RepID=UPI0011B3D58E|nr:hypothetical protein [Novipirellula artificiosorum]